MESKYNVKSIFNYELYREYVKLCNKELAHIHYRSRAIAAVCLVLAGCFLLCHAYLFFIGAAVLLIALPLVFTSQINHGIKKNWENNFFFENLETEIHFFDDYLLQMSERGQNKVEYDMIYRILESDNIFALILAGNQGIMIDKNNCSEELMDFCKNNICV